MTVDVTPRFSLAEAQRFGHDFFRVTALATALPSERDQNFVLKTENGEKFVLKIAKSDEDRAVIDFQNAMMRHAAQRAPNLMLPRPIASCAGDDVVSVQDASGRSYLMRLMTWLDGTIFVDARTEDRTLLATLGTALAELDLALQDFSHPAMHRTLQWDVKHAHLAQQHLSLLSEEQQRVVKHCLCAWSKIDWATLRCAVIHGDANDYNVLVKNERVVGFLDFGDVVYSAVACDLAIALAYAMMAQRDPLAAGAAVVAAYQQIYPLTRSEIEALYPLTTARLCMSLCYAAYNARAKPGDAYQLVTAAPAWNLLRQLAAESEDSAQDIFLRACELR